MIKYNTAARASFDQIIIRNHKLNFYSFLNNSQIQSCSFLHVNFVDDCFDVDLFRFAHLHHLLLHVVEVHDILIEKSTLRLKIKQPLLECSDGCLSALNFCLRRLGANQTLLLEVEEILGLGLFFFEELLFLDVDVKDCSISVVFTPIFRIFFHLQHLEVNKFKHLRIWNIHLTFLNTSLELCLPLILLFNSLLIICDQGWQLFLEIYQLCLRRNNFFI